MKNKLFLLSLLAAFVFAGFAFTEPQAIQTMEVDVANSQIKWKGEKVTGSHEGTIQLQSGSLDFDKGLLKGGSFIVDMSTIEVTDLTGGGAAKLKGHLSSKDFFGIEEFPTATFQSTSVSPTATAGEYTIDGNITIKGITQALTFTAKVDVQGESAVATGKITIDRTKFGIRYGSGSFFDNLGDKTIYDDFELNVNLVASK